MNIEWSITKKRGNLRPVCTFTISLGEFELELGMPAVRIESTIPKPPDSSWTHCWPGQNERGPWTPTEYYLLMTPSHKTGTVTERIKLPWREDNSYPEVEESFTALRDAFERVLAASANSVPMDMKGRLETSGTTKRIIAPACVAERFLRAVQA